MPDFAFSPNGHAPAGQEFSDSENDVLAHHGEARRLQRHLKKAGHDARIESHPNSEHRVWVQHPEHEDTAAYVSKADAHDASFKPYWIRK